MSLIEGISLQNFKNFRDKATFDLRQSSYLIGVNNAGKTNIFHGIRAFFNDQYFTDESFLNRISFSRKQSGYNQSQISITFSLEAIKTTSRKVALQKKYGKTITVTKLISFLPISGTIGISWKILKDEYIDLPPDIDWLFKKIKITYIHPQEGKQLLSMVQARLKQRLLANWGRNAALSHSLQDLQTRWDEMRNSANRYLSQSLSDSLQPFWPDCKVTIDLPKNIQEVINISDIGFQGYKGAPEIELTAQGTGAQSTVLYQAHYLLESDRSLNRGEYHPIWLMEEPESFLHADLLIKLTKQLNSKEWLENIQMIISTHSAILLAGSRAANMNVVWNIIESNTKKESLFISDISDEKINEIGTLMGDQNFFVYFNFASAPDEENILIFLEDERQKTSGLFIEAGIPVTKGLRGISEIKRFLDVLSSSPKISDSKTYFIVDGDKGLETIRSYVDSATLKVTKKGFVKLTLRGLPNVFLILLPDDTAVENLFDEYDDHISECVSEIWDDSFKCKKKTPSHLSGAVSKARRMPVTNFIEAASLIANEDEVKSIFWKDVEKNGYKISSSKAKIIKDLMS